MMEPRNARIFPCCYIRHAALLSQRLHVSLPCTNEGVGSRTGKASEKALWNLFAIPENSPARVRLAPPRVRALHGSNRPAGAQAGDKSRLWPRKIAARRPQGRDSVTNPIRSALTNQRGHDALMTEFGHAGRQCQPTRYDVPPAWRLNLGGRKAALFHARGLTTRNTAGWSDSSCRSGAAGSSGRYTNNSRAAAARAASRAWRRRPLQ